MSNFKKGTRFKKGDILFCINNRDTNGAIDITHDELYVNDKYIASHDSYIFYNVEYIGIDGIDDAFPVDLFKSIQEMRVDKIRNLF